MTRSPRTRLWGTKHRRDQAKNMTSRASTLSAAAAAGVQSARVRIEHQELHFRYQFTFVVAGKPFEGAFELVTDGREVTHTERGRLTVSTLRWDGDALVSTDRREGTSTFRYEVLDAGHCLRWTYRIRA